MLENILDETLETEFSILSSIIHCCRDSRVLEYTIHMGVNTCIGIEKKYELEAELAKEEKVELR